MAMMMTGHVLLLCALCVLWCGVYAVGVSKADDSESTDASQGPAGRPQSESADRNAGQQESSRQFSQERQNAGGPLDPKNEATENQKKDPNTEEPRADELRDSKGEAHKEQIEGGAGREESEKLLGERNALQDGRSSEGEAEQAGNGLAKVGSHSSARGPSEGERQENGKPSPPASSLPPASTQVLGAAPPASLQAASAAAALKTNEKTAVNPIAEKEKEKVSSEDEVSEQTSQRVNDGVEPKNASQKEESISVALTKQNGESDGDSESTQARPLAVDDASNTDAERGTEIGLPTNNPDS
ncbi:mucin-associated surface protein (MASP), putative [Trypanosoma cruzi marinkellei]|uniref:Mucin-associated surface protein (MASP), putative n=1 Tax=Trypanosoma cruzi marinkellei TaxID=85056 RepID=K2NPR6_TRYCR|nr:mucin-associated surface protein (MASP), putative [Trypanosoma cruzi marinkellei]